MYKGLHAFPKCKSEQHHSVTGVGTRLLRCYSPACLPLCHRGSSFTFWATFLNKTKNSKMSFYISLQFFVILYFLSRIFWHHSKHHVHLKWYQFVFCFFYYNYLLCSVEVAHMTTFDQLKTTISSAFEACRSTRISLFFPLYGFSCKTIEMDPVTQVQILNEVVCNVLSSNILGKGRSPTNSFLKYQ